MQRKENNSMIHKIYNVRKSRIDNRKINKPFNQKRQNYKRNRPWIQTFTIIIKGRPTRVTFTARTAHQRRKLHLIRLLLTTKFDREKGYYRWQMFHKFRKFKKWPFRVWYPRRKLKRIKKRTHTKFLFHKMTRLTAVRDKKWQSRRAKNFLKRQILLKYFSWKFNLNKLVFERLIRQNLNRNSTKLLSLYTYLNFRVDVILSRFLYPINLSGVHNLISLGWVKIDNLPTYDPSTVLRPNGVLQTVVWNRTLINRRSSFRKQLLPWNRPNFMKLTPLNNPVFKSWRREARWDQRKYYNQKYRRPLKYTDNVLPINNITGLNINSILTYSVKRKFKRRLLLRALLTRSIIKRVNRSFLKSAGKKIVKTKSQSKLTLRKGRYTKVLLRIKKSNWRLLKKAKNRLQLRSGSKKLIWYRRVRTKLVKMLGASGLKRVKKRVLDRLKLCSVWGKPHKKRRLTYWWRKRMRKKRLKTSGRIKSSIPTPKYKKKYLNYRLKLLFLNNATTIEKLKGFDRAYAKSLQSYPSKILMKRSFIQTFTEIRRIKSRGKNFDTGAKVVKLYRYYLKLNANKRAISTVFWSVNPELSQLNSKLNILLKKRVLWKDPLFILSLDVLTYFLSNKARRMLR